jgi:hypothetical protein
MDEQRCRPPPLTAAALQELNRTMKSATGRHLLWEIHRLRALVLPAHHLEILVRDNRRMFEDANVRNLINALRVQLDGEPAIEEEMEKEVFPHQALIVGHPAGFEPTTPWSQNNKAWRRARRARGIPDLHIHDVRHTDGM